MIILCLHINTLWLPVGCLRVNLEIRTSNADRVKLLTCIYNTINILFKYILSIIQTKHPVEYGEYIDLSLRHSAASKLKSLLFARDETRTATTCSSRRANILRCIASFAFHICSIFASYHICGQCVCVWLLAFKWIYIVLYVYLPGIVDCFN